MESVPDDRRTCVVIVQIGGENPIFSGLVIDRVREVREIILTEMIDANVSVEYQLEHSCFTDSPVMGTMSCLSCPSPKLPESSNNRGRQRPSHFQGNLHEIRTLANHCLCHHYDGDHPALIIAVIGYLSQRAAVGDLVAKKLESFAVNITDRRRSKFLNVLVMSRHSPSIHRCGKFRCEKYHQTGEHAHWSLWLL